MPVLALGTDLTDVARVRDVLDRHGGRFLDRVLTPAERVYCERSRPRLPERLAGRFAAKEAIVKALGTGFRGGLSWQDMEILPDALGAPTLRLSGVAATVGATRGIVRWHVSISHVATYAMAVVVGEGDGTRQRLA